MDEKRLFGRNIELFLVILLSVSSTIAPFSTVKKNKIMDVIARIAQELAVKPQQVSATVALLDEGATVPFIARYRKEMTVGLCQVNDIKIICSTLEKIWSNH